MFNSHLKKKKKVLERVLPVHDKLAGLLTLVNVFITDAAALQTPAIQTAAFCSCRALCVRHAAWCQILFLSMNQTSLLSENFIHKKKKNEQDNIADVFSLSSFCLAAGDHIIPSASTQSDQDVTCQF